MVDGLEAEPGGGCELLETVACPPANDGCEDMIISGGGWKLVDGVEALVLSKGWYWFKPEPVLAAKVGLFDWVDGINKDAVLTALETLLKAVEATLLGV